MANFSKIVVDPGNAAIACMQVGFIGWHSFVCQRPTPTTDLD